MSNIDLADIIFDSKVDEGIRNELTELSFKFFGCEGHLPTIGVLERDYEMIERYAVGTTYSTWQT